MSRTKSSNLDRLNDLIDGLADVCHKLHEEFDKLKTDSERLKEIEPALNRLQSALKPSVPEFFDGSQLQKSSAGDIVAISQPPLPPVNREKHPRKKKEPIPPEEPPQQ